MSILQRTFWGAGVCALLVQPLAGRAESTNALPPFKEVYGLIREHLAGATETDLDHAAVEGLLKQLHSKVSLGSKEAEISSPAAGPLLGKTVVFDGSIACLRVARVSAEVTGQMASAIKDLNPGGTNQLRGIVLDLRFAGGADYAAAAAAADLFLTNEAPLLDPGTGMIKSTVKPDAITLPVAVLVNHETIGAAEALAALLHDHDNAMILGAETAGEAMGSKAFALSNGEYLRIATSPIKIGNGDFIPATGVKPDIAVTVRAREEKAYFEDPYRELPASGRFAAAFGITNSASGSVTNRPSRTRTTEADLIRERKENPGVDLDSPSLRRGLASSGQPEAERPVVRDPVLGRALDLLKGLAVMREARR